MMICLKLNKSNGRITSVNTKDCDICFKMKAYHICDACNNSCCTMCLQSHLISIDGFKGLCLIKRCQYCIDRNLIPDIMYFDDDRKRIY